MSDGSGASVMQWVRNVVMVGMVAVMAAASSGGLGALAWTGGPFPGPSMWQADNTQPTPDNTQPTPDNTHSSPDNDDPIPAPPGQTMLATDICPGAGHLLVGQTTGFAVGDIVRINAGGATQEDGQVVDVGCGGRILHLAEALQFRHVFGEAVVVTGRSQSGSSSRSSNDREREQQKPKTEEARRQTEHTNRSGRDDYSTEGNVIAVDLTKQPPEIIIATRDGSQTVQLRCGDQCPKVRVGDYVEIDGTKENEGLFYADGVTISGR